MALFRNYVEVLKHKKSIENNNIHAGDTFTTDEVVECLERTVTNEGRINTLETNLNAQTAALNSHKTAAVLDHPDRSVNTNKIAYDTVTGGSAANQGNIAQKTIQAYNIADNTITYNQIADGTIRSVELGTGCVTNEKLASESVKGVNIYPATITGSKILTNQIKGGTNTSDSHITEKSVTGYNIADATISKDKLTNALKTEIESAVTQTAMADSMASIQSDLGSLDSRVTNLEMNPSSSGTIPGLNNLETSTQVGIVDAVNEVFDMVNKNSFPYEYKNLSYYLDNSGWDNTKHIGSGDTIYVYVDRASWDSDNNSIYGEYYSESATSYYILTSVSNTYYKTVGDLGNPVTLQQRHFYKMYSTSDSSEQFETGKYCYTIYVEDVTSLYGIDRIGDITELNTTNKGNVVSAVNEIHYTIGLDTALKTNAAKVIPAINELYDTVDEIHDTVNAVSDSFSDDGYLKRRFVGELPYSEENINSSDNIAIITLANDPTGTIRLSKSVTEDTGYGGNVQVLTTAGNAGNGRPFAYIDFSDYSTGAEQLTIEFDCKGESAGRWYVGLSDISKRPATSNKTTYDTSGVAFCQGRTDQYNRCYINKTTSEYLNMSAGVNVWTRTKVTLDFSKKKATYSIYGIDENFTSVKGGVVDFKDATTTQVTGLEVYMWTGSTNLYIGNINISVLKGDDRTLYIQRNSDGTYTDYIFRDNKPVAIATTAVNAELRTEMGNIKDEIYGTDSFAVGHTRTDILQFACTSRSGSYPYSAVLTCDDIHSLFDNVTINGNALQQHIDPSYAVNSVSISGTFFGEDTYWRLVLDINLDPDDIDGYPIYGLINAYMEETDTEETGKILLKSDTGLRISLGSALLDYDNIQTQSSEFMSFQSFEDFVSRKTELSDLVTTDKTSIIAAINELAQRLSALES